MSNSNLTTIFKALGATCLLAISSVSHAQIVPFSDDFEGYGVGGVPSVDNFFLGTPGRWLGFSDNGGFPGGYSYLPGTRNMEDPGPPLIPVSQITQLAWNGSDNQYLNFFANYNNQNVHDRVGCLTLPPNFCSPNEQEAISVYQDMPFDATDTANGDTWVFSFDFQENALAPPAGATEVGAYIRVFDPVRNLLHEVALDTSGSTNWRKGILSVTLDPDWLEGFFQIGFNNLVGNYEDSGVFYDNVSLAKALNPLVEIEGRGATNALHLHHSDLLVTPNLDDIVPVVVYGQDTLVGDPVDLNVLSIINSSGTFGPGDAPIYTAVQATDVDLDGLTDKRFKFAMSETGLGQRVFGCGDPGVVSKANLSGELNTGVMFAGSDNFTPNCNAGCHSGP